MIQAIRNVHADRLSDELQAAIDTDNAQGVADALAAAEEALTAGEIDILQLQALRTDAEVAGYDY